MLNRRQHKRCTGAPATLRAQYLKCVEGTTASSIWQLPIDHGNWHLTVKDCLRKNPSDKIAESCHVIADTTRPAPQGYQLERLTSSDEELQAAEALKSKIMILHDMLGDLAKQSDTCVSPDQRAQLESLSTASYASF